MRYQPLMIDKHFGMCGVGFSHYLHPVIRQACSSGSQQEWVCGQYIVVETWGHRGISVYCFVYHLLFKTYPAALPFKDLPDRSQGGSLAVTCLCPVQCALASGRCGTSCGRIESHLRCPHTLRKSFGVRLCPLQICDIGEVIHLVSSIEWFNNISFPGLFEDKMTFSHPDYVSDTQSFMRHRPAVSLISLRFQNGYRKLPIQCVAFTLHLASLTSRNQAAAASQEDRVEAYQKPAWLRFWFKAS